MSISPIRIDIIDCEGVLAELNFDAVFILDEVHLAVGALTPDRRRRVIIGVMILGIYAIELLLNIAPYRPAY